jgi:MoaA/NifB/PqqE/SkfB family radical SAM enzyme
MCGRRKIDRDYPELKLEYGFMPFELLEKISKEIPPGIIVQFHNNGEPLMYPRLKEALSLFKGQVKALNTNGILLMDRKDAIVDTLDTITISTFQDDPDGDRQLDILEEFIQYKGARKPNVIIRCLGDIGVERRNRIDSYGLLVADRILHSPMGSFSYTKKTVVPEAGVCLEMVGHPAINIKGDLSICVRFDPERKGVLGNIRNMTMDEMWNSDKRKQWLDLHISGSRKSVPLCEKCDFWGVPRG